MPKLIGNTVIIVASGFLITSGVIALGMVCLYASSVVLARRLKAAVGESARQA